MIEQATRSSMMPMVQSFMRDNPHTSDRVDNSLYFATFKVAEPEHGSDALRLGNWTELLPEEEAAVVAPACSKNNRDDGLFEPELASDEDCSTSIRLGVVDVRHWPPIIYINFMGKFFWTKKIENSF